MPATPTYGLRYPLTTDPVNVPGDLQNLATDVESVILSGSALSSVQVSGTTVPAHPTINFVGPEWYSFNDTANNRTNIGFVTDLTPAIVKAPGTSGQNTIQSTSDIVPLNLKGMAGQTVPYLQCRDSANVQNWAIEMGGIPKWALASSIQTTVGTAGGASALPATPAKYLKVKDNSGSTFVVPAYNP